MKRVLRDFSMSVIGLLIASAVASAQLSTARLSGRRCDSTGNPEATQPLLQIRRDRTL